MDLPKIGFPICPKLTGRSVIVWPSVVIAAIAVAPVVMADEAVDYERDIKPVLAERCYACHGALKQESALRLDTVAAVMAGGASGSAVERGRADVSLIVERVSSGNDDRMPPEGDPLTRQQLKLLRTWINQGARGPDTEQPQADPRLHWAFQPPRATR